MAHIVDCSADCNLVQNVRCPILLIHSLNDADIAPAHSRRLYDTLLGGEGKDQLGNRATEVASRIADFGTLRTFTRQGNKRLSVSHLETKYGVRLCKLGCDTYCANRSSLIGP